MNNINNIKKANDGRIAYGSESAIDVLDDLGSTIEVETPIHAGQLMPNQYKKYKERHKIKNAYDLTKALLKWSDKIAEDGVINPEIDTEMYEDRTKQGFYLLVTSWTVKIK